MTSILTPGRDRRYFPRVAYRAYATLVTTRQRWPVHILDLSFNGALAALIHRHDLKDGEELILTIELDDGDSIKMQGKLSHQRAHFLGIECRASGIDNQARLRDLLEKNKETTGDPERSLDTMLHEHEESYD
ncbi:PilZ domain-containing protein [Exilibacterium tricleocarpae]|uniref:PilZ domain-containing protein n=1 Tax=Exilibacterium tricleocarpae TaxID=2591008 RepID=A0A545SPT9_9GAMM|nr:PilZ domain-containing protein [Exilibacterium tricleocarpae]TQV66993.1 PilZ domain-containing protein [Exilibacterium tricleocarpae]